MRKYEPVYNISNEFYPYRAHLISLLLVIFDTDGFPGKIPVHYFLVLFKKKVLVPLFCSGIILSTCLPNGYFNLNKSDT
ncbi:hypothetical protein KKA14_17775, partial [bacterium]|nr:hypothetical protein [bacterium]